MTRINCIPPQELTDKHLFAEWREMPRLVGNLNKSLNRKSKPFTTQEIPDTYTLGKGHVKFFYNKFTWLHERHRNLTKELLKRNFNLGRTDSDVFLEVPEEYKNSWQPTEEAMRINRERIRERLS